MTKRLFFPCWKITDGDFLIQVPKSTEESLLIKIKQIRSYTT